MDFTKAQTKEIHKRVKQAIASRKMKMKDFYQLSGVSSSLFSQYKTGTTATSYTSVGKMADALSVDLDYLLSGLQDIKDGEGQSPHPAGDGPFTAEFAAIYNQLSPERRADLDRQARLLLLEQQSQEGASDSQK